MPSSAAAESDNAVLPQPGMPVSMRPRGGGSASAIAPIVAVVDRAVGPVGLIRARSASATSAGR